MTCYSRCRRDGRVALRVVLTADLRVFRVLCVALHKVRQEQPLQSLRTHVCCHKRKEVSCGSQPQTFEKRTGHTSA